MQNIFFCYRTSYSGLEIPNTVLELRTVLEKILKNIKRAGQDRRAGGKFSSKLINVHARLFGTLEYLCFSNVFATTEDSSSNDHLLA